MKRMLVPLLLGIFLIAGFFVAIYHFDQPTLDYYPELGGDFSLINHENTSMNLKDYRGKVVLLNFGYTSCPDICPITLARLKQLTETLGKQADQVQTLFISIDPERDTTERLQAYVTYFNPTFMGLTGTPEALTKVAKQYGGTFYKQDVQSAVSYLFAHTDYIYLIDQEGQLRAFYKTETPLEQMKTGIQSLLN